MAKKNIWEALDFENIEQYYDYIDSSRINGNFSQLKGLVKDMTNDQRKGFFSYAREMGYTETVNWINEKMAKGGEVKSVKYSELPKLIKIGYLRDNAGDTKKPLLDSEESFHWGAETEKEYNEAQKEIDNIEAKGKGWKLYAWYDVSSFDYWMKKQQEQNYIQITISFDSENVDESEIKKIEDGLAQALYLAGEIQNKYNYKPSTYAKGGEAGKPKVKSIKKYALSSDKGTDISYDEFVRLIDADKFAQQKSLSVKEVKKILNDLEPDEELDKFKTVDEIAEYLRENNIVRCDNTYNQSYWGNAILHCSMGIGKRDGEQLLFLAMHISGDVRGNYTEFKAYKYDNIEDVPFYQWNLIVEIKTNKGEIRLQSEGDEAYHFYVEKDETGTWEEGDTIKHPDLDEKLDMDKKDIWMAKGGSVQSSDLASYYAQHGAVIWGGYFTEMCHGGYMAGGGKVSGANILEKIKKEGKITEQEVNLIKNRMNKGNLDVEHEVLVQWIWDNQPELTADQNKKGLDFLMNQWKSPTGTERKNNPFGFREQKALETFKHFTLDGFHDASRYGGRPYYIPLYGVTGEEEGNFQYYYDGKVNIIGAKGGEMAKGGEVEKVKELLRKEKVNPDDVSPNFVNDFAHKHGIKNLTSEQVVKISDTYEMAKGGGVSDKFVITSKDQPNELFLGHSIGGKQIQWVEKWRKPITFTSESEANEFNDRINMDGQVVKKSSGGSMATGGEVGAEKYWNSLTMEERHKFFTDHKDELKSISMYLWVGMKYKDLPTDLTDVIKNNSDGEHHGWKRMATGGVIFSVGDEVIVNTGGNDTIGVIWDKEGKSTHGHHWKEQDSYLVQFDNNTSQYIPKKYIKRKLKEGGSMATGGDIKEMKVRRGISYKGFYITQWATHAEIKGYSDMSGTFFQSGDIVTTEQAKQAIDLALDKNNIPEIKDIHKRIVHFSDNRYNKNLPEKNPYIKKSYGGSMATGGEAEDDYEESYDYGRPVYKGAFVFDDGGTDGRYTVIFEDTGNIYSISYPHGVNKYLSNVTDRVNITQGYGWKKGHTKKSLARILESELGEYLSQAINDKSMAGKEIRNESEIPDKVKKYIDGYSKEKTTMVEGGSMATGDEN